MENKYVIIFVLISLPVIKCIDEEWDIFEESFINDYREELIVTQVSTDNNFKVNQTVLKWASFSLRSTSYSAGISAEDSKKLVVLVSKLSPDGSHIVNEVKIFYLEENAGTDLHWYYQNGSNNSKLLLVIYFPKRKEISWFELNTNDMEKVWKVQLDQVATHINLFRVLSKNFIFVINEFNERTPKFTAVFYEFDKNLEHYWFSHSINITSPVHSSAVSNFEDNFFLSFSQNSRDTLEIYLYEEGRFNPYLNMSSSNITQVVSFENGFKSFLAINGQNAGIYEFTKHGLVAKSNFEELDFWLPIPVQNYRYETILIAQRVLNHGTHKSFDFDIFTYNGHSYEEHEDIPCNFFGEEENSLKCFGEYGSNLGISGASYISIERILGLLIPNTNGMSLLFMIENKLRPIPNPSELEITEILAEKKILEKMLDDNERKAKEINAKSNSEKRDSSRSSSKSADALKSLANMEILSKKASQLEQDVNALQNHLVKTENQAKIYHTITFNKPVKIKAQLKSDKVTSDKLNGNETSSILQDIVSIDNLKNISSTKTFLDIEVDNVLFETINGISKDDFVIKNSEKLSIDGHVNFSNAVVSQYVTSHLINNITVEKEWIDVNQDIEVPIKFDHIDVEGNFYSTVVNNRSFHFNNIQLDSYGVASESTNEQKSVVFPANVTVENINGDKLETFLSKLCLNTLKCFIPKLNILGNITVTGSAETEYLNNVKYPEDYVLYESIDNEEVLKISGSKIFLDIIRGYEVESNSTVNEIDPKNFIDNNAPQTIKGQVVFKDLEVNSVLEVTGKIKGNTAEKFLQNLDLNETDTLKSNVEFENLEVIGNIIVQNRYGNVTLEEILKDIILKDDKLANIDATKEFLSTLTVLKNLNIDSSAIANVSLDEIIAKDTNEDLNIRSIYGNIDIENLSLEGIFDDRNITELNSTLLKIDENANISSVLIFESVLNSSSLKIEKLNEKSPDEYFYNSFENTTALNNSILQNVTAEKLIVEGSFKGNMSNFNFSEFIKNTLKYTEDQIIGDIYSINKSVLHDLKVLNLNNLSYNDVFSCTNFTQKLIKVIISGEARVKQLALNGSVNLDKLKNEDINESLKNKLWSKLRANGGKNVIIEGNVYFSKIDINELASVNFEAFVESLVFKDDGNVTIKDTVTFQEVILTNKLLQTENINDIAIENILRNDGEQIIRSDITLYGTVRFVENTFISNDINEVSTEYLVNNFEINEHIISIDGDVLFERLAIVENLTIDGLINDQDLGEIKSKYVYLDQNISLVENTILSNIVNVIGHLEVSNSTNTININDLDKIVWKTRNTTISGPTRFMKSVEVFDALNVDEEINARYLFNEILEDKLRNSVHIDRGLLAGEYIFKDISISDNLNIKFLNSLNMATIVPLKSEQFIEYLNVGKFTILNDMKVGGLVNDVNLLEEMNNTKLVNTDQLIQSEVIFLNNTLVEKNLITKIFNAYAFDNIVFLHFSQNLSAVYEFVSNVWVNQDAMVDGLINGADISRLNKTSLKSFSNNSQIFEEDTEVSNAITFVDSVSKSGYINGINLTNLAKKTEEKKKYRLLVENGIQNDYTNLCTDVTYIYKNVLNQIYKFKYFENLQKLTFSSAVHSIKHLTTNNKHYILVNEKNCFSHLMEWEENEFKPSERFYTGQIDQIAVAFERNNVYLVARHSNSNGKCNMENSTLIWLMREENNLEVIGSIENQDLLQESMVEGTFYGLRNNVVTKFKITLESEQIAVPTKKWKIKSFRENLAFMPRNLKTGLCLRTGRELIFLNNHNDGQNENIIFDSHTEEFAIGNYTIQHNIYVPGRKDGEVTVANVGTKGRKTNLMIVSSHKHTQVQHRLDLIEIYTDASSGQLFDKIPTFKPSSLLSVDFGNGETLLVFLEDNKLLQVYEYKGIEGFKHRSTIRINGSSMFVMELPIEPHSNPRKVIGVVNEGEVILMEAVMSGSKVNENLACDIH